MGTLTYKEYEGTVDFDSERMTLRGKILFITDLVTYEAADVPGLQREFEAAVDDYVETCRILGRSPQKPSTGQFSVRISPSLHRKALENAARENLYLNDVVTRALDAYLNATTANNTYHVTVNVPENSPIIAAATTAASTNIVWENRSVH